MISGRAKIAAFLFAATAACSGTSNDASPSSTTCATDAGASLYANADSGIVAVTNTNSDAAASTNHDVDAAGEDAAATTDTMAKVRAFNFLGPRSLFLAVDVCLQSTDTPNAPWLGPIYRDSHTYARYGTAAPYVDVPPGHYKARITLWGSAFCEATLAGAEDDVTLDAPLVAGAYHSLEIRGWVLDGQDGVAKTPVTVNVLPDRATFAANELNVRVLNADPAVSGVDVYYQPPTSNSPADWQLLMDNIQLGDFGVASASSFFGATASDGYVHEVGVSEDDSIMHTSVLCPHGSTTTGCWAPGWQYSHGNVTLFVDVPAWAYDWVVDGAVVFDSNQPSMVQTDSWW